MKRNPFFTGLFYAFAIGLVLWGVSACTAWKWQECRKVGHGVAYCVLAGSR